MTARVISPFFCRMKGKLFNVGDDYEGERVEELAALGYVEADKPASKPKPTTKRTRKTAPKE